MNFNAGDVATPLYPCNADTDLIMEWLVDFVLTCYNFWRGAPKREDGMEKNTSGDDSGEYDVPGTRMST